MGLPQQGRLIVGGSGADFDGFWWISCCCPRGREFPLASGSVGDSGSEQGLASAGRDACYASAVMCRGRGVTGGGLRGRVHRWAVSLCSPVLAAHALGAATCSLGKFQLGVCGTESMTSAFATKYL